MIIDEKNGNVLVGYLNLADALADYVGMGFSVEFIDEEFKEKMDTAMFSLTSEQRDAIAYKFGFSDGLLHTDGETAKFFESTTDKIRQLLAKAFRILIQPQNSKLFLYYFRNEKQNQARNFAAMKALRKQYYALRDHLRRRRDMDEDLFIIEFGEMGYFSPRTVNALYRNGIRTLGVLTQKSTEELEAIQNLGNKSMQEIKFILDKFFNQHKLSDISTVKMIGNLSFQEVEKYKLLDARVCQMLQNYGFNSFDELADSDGAELFFMEGIFQQDIADIVYLMQLYLSDRNQEQKEAEVIK